MPKSISLKIRSNAKINLALRITARRPDGYHDLSTVFQEIDFYDTLEFTPANRFSFGTLNPDLPVNEDNLCTRAYRLMESLAPNGQPYQIFLTKQIPIGAGLGGGSSNAAAVLKFLNQSWQLNLAESELIRLARRLGADVPFYIHGGTQAATGVGEVLTPLELPEKFTVLLVLPDINISTAWAYRQFEPADCKPPYDLNAIADNGRIHWELFENQFEAVVFPVYPQLARLKRQIQDAGANYAGLSGSGSAMFGIFCDRRRARAAADRLTGWPCRVVDPVR